MVGLAPKWVKLDPKLDKSGTFSDQISVHLARWAKCTEILSEKVPDLSHLRSIWLTLEPNLPSLYPGQSRHVVLCSVLNKAWITEWLSIGPDRLHEQVRQSLHLCKTNVGKINLLEERVQHYKIYICFNVWRENFRVSEDDVIRRNICTLGHVHPLLRMKWL